MSSDPQEHVEGFEHIGHRPWNCRDHHVHVVNVFANDLAAYMNFRRWLSVVLKVVEVPGCYRCSGLSVALDPLMFWHRHFLAGGVKTARC